MLLKLLCLVFKYSCGLVIVSVTLLVLWFSLVGFGLWLLNVLICICVSFVFLLLVVLK